MIFRSNAEFWLNHAAKVRFPELRVVGSNPIARFTDGPAVAGFCEVRRGRDAATVDPPEKLRVEFSVLTDCGEPTKVQSGRMPTARLKAVFRSKRGPISIHPGEWPEHAGKPRVLIENPDRADLWAHAELLRGAGYDVAICGGPVAEIAPARWYRRLVSAAPGPTERQQRVLCPLVTAGRCSLVEGADVVVSTIHMTDSREVLAALTARTSPVLVVEGTSAGLERERAAIGDSVEIQLPVLPQQLVLAVERARYPHLSTASAPE